MDFFEFNNTKVSYALYGKGKTILFIHGFGECSKIWHNQISYLKNKFQILTIDLPGSGNSEHLNQEDVEIDTYATIIYEVVQHLIDKKIINTTFSIFGHSMGGYITLAFIKKYSNFIDVFGLINSTAFADSEEKKQIRLKSIEFINQFGAEQFLQTAIPNLFSNTSKTLLINEISELKNGAKKFKNSTLNQYYGAMIKRPNYTDILKKTNKPMLFIIGNEDLAAPMQDVLQQTYLCNISQINIFLNTAHMSMLEAKDDLNSAISHFLQRFC